MTVNLRVSASYAAPDGETAADRTALATTFLQDIISALATGKVEGNVAKDGKAVGEWKLAAK